jgi:large subunit ribosomal protein L35
MTKIKMKTNKGAARRFKITGTGKVMRAKGGKSHNRRKKASRSRRMLDKMLVVAPQDQKRIKRLLPYGLD